MNMDILKDDGYGGHRSSDSTSGAAILGAFIPTFIIACVYIAIFVAVRNSFRKVYAPRTFLGTIPKKDRTPASHAEGTSWIQDYRSLTDRFVFQHNSLDAYLYLRFLKFIIWVCFAGACLTWPILFPINATGGGDQTQLDRFSFSNIAKNNHIWAHTVVAWVLFLGIFVVIAVERLQLIGIRQAVYLSETHASKLSAKTVLFMNVPSDALQTENLKRFFGEKATRAWPVKDMGDLPELVEKRNGAARGLESAEMDLIVKAVKLQRKGTGGSAEEDQSLVPKAHRPTSRKPPIVGTKVDRVEAARNEVVELAEKIEAHRAAPGRNVHDHSAIFVSFSDQQAAHRAFQQITFQPKLPLEDRFLAVQPKEVIWKNVALPSSVRLSKASLALVFVIAFTIFFSIPVGLIGTLSNAKQLADKVKFLRWLNDLPPWLLGLLTGFVPPFLTSWFVSYVPKLFRHIAKLSGEPTIPQAELKTQAWFMVFQVVQVFLITTFSSGAAAVATKIARDPASAPDLLAQSLPTASNFYLTYFILQGTTSAASNLLDYSETAEYLFYEYFWSKTPREKFETYAQMRGTPWASWYPKFTNFLIIAVVYSCIQPLTLGFAALGVFFYYLSYRYSLLYVRQTKTDTKGEAYKRALQQMPTALYLAELCLIGLFGARKAKVQTALMIVLLVLTAVANFTLDRILRPLELYLGSDKWQDEERLLAEEDGEDPDDAAARHAAAHGRRLGLVRLPTPLPRKLSDLFDGIISKAKAEAQGWLNAAGVEEKKSGGARAPAMTYEWPQASPRLDSGAQPTHRHRTHRSKEDRRLCPAFLSWKLEANSDTRLCNQPPGEGQLSRI
jgi:hypothetical protein